MHPALCSWMIGLVVNTNVPLSVPRNHSGVFKTHWESGKVKNKNQQKNSKVDYHQLYLSWLW